MTTNWTLNANSASSLMMYDGYHIRITSRNGGTNKNSTVRRRFVYCWRRKKDAKEWENLGLKMTDDDGKLFDLETFFKDKKLVESKLQVNKYNPTSKKFENRTWQFYGDSEDVLCFQKFCGDRTIGKPSKLSTNAATVLGGTVCFQLCDENAGVVYANPFYVEDKYLLSIAPGYEYFFMYCPPDIILKGVSTHSSRNNASGMSVLKDTATPEFKCIKEPLKLWLENTYITSKGEKVEDVVARTGVSLSEIEKVKSNQGKIPAKGKTFAEGVTLSIPPQLTSDHGFGRLVDLKGFVNTANAKTLDYNSENAVIIDIPVLDLPLPVTLEENISQLGAMTIMLDITWAKIVESTKVFYETSNKLTNIADLLDLMLRFPGYKTRQSWGSSARYLQKMHILSQNLKNVRDAFVNAESLAKDLLNAAYTDQNPVVKIEKKALVKYVDAIILLLKDKSFITSLTQWRIFRRTAKQQNEYPFCWDKDKIPVLYSAIETVVQLMMGICVEHSRKDEDITTFAHHFYKEIMFSFENVLIKIFDSLDKTNNYSDNLANKLKIKGILNPEKSDAPVLDLQPDSVTNIIFKDIVTDTVLKDASSHLNNILKVTTQCRASRILAGCEMKQHRMALTNVKLTIAGMFITGNTPQQIKQKHQDALNAFEKNKSRLAAQKERIEGHLKQSDEAIEKVTADLKYLEGSIGACYYLWSIYEFGEKLSQGEDFEYQEWVEIAGLIQSGWAIAAGLDWALISSDMKVLRHIQAKLLRKLGLKKRQFLRGAMAVYEAGEELFEKVNNGVEMIFMPVEMYKKCAGCYADWLTGDEVKVYLRGVQAGINIASYFGGPWGKAVAALADVGIEATIMIREAMRLGIQNSVASLKNDLVNDGLLASKGTILDNVFMRKKHTELYSHATYLLATNDTILSVIPSAVRYSVDPALVGRLRTLSTLISDLDYINLDIVKAGSILKSKGYADNDIAYITMEIAPEGSRFSLSDFEKKYIAGFAQTGTFALQNSLDAVLKGSFRDPKDDYYYKNPPKTFEDEATFNDPPKPTKYFMDNYNISV